MKKIINLYKPISLTPLQVIKIFREKNPEYKNIKIAYAGRLDPMAHGVLVLLVGDECKKRDKYQRLDKEYEFEILFGIETDTYDILGIPKLVDIDYDHNDILRATSYELRKLNGEYLQQYPAYSSMVVKGHPLFWWARQGRLDEIKIPKKKVTIQKIEILSSRQLAVDSILRIISNKIKAVDGDFRQEEILNTWGKLLAPLETHNLQLIKFHARVSSGTYIRSIASDFGLKLGTGAIAFDILRTKVGEHELEDAYRLACSM